MFRYITPLSRLGISDMIKSASFIQEINYQQDKQRQTQFRIKRQQNNIFSTHIGKISARNIQHYSAVRLQTTQY